MADILRWDPFNDMLSLRQAMNRLFEDAWVRPPGVVGGGTGWGNMPIDLHETADDYVITATMPGVKPEDLNISLQGNLLTISGEAKHDGDVEESSYHVRERGF